MLRRFRPKALASAAATFFTPPSSLTLSHSLPATTTLLLPSDPLHTDTRSSMADNTALLDADGLQPYDEHQHNPVAFNILPVSSADAAASDSTPSVVAYSADFRPSQPWSHYFTLNSLTRRKTTAIVMQEAAEDSGNPTPPSHSSTSRPPTPDPLEHAPILPPIHPQAKVGLLKVLTVWDVIAYGVSSTIGAGIFVSTGAGALSAGPAVTVSFLLASVSCLFSAFAYCEFASRVPVSGSAYTFTYVTMGELAAWFIGWNLTLEYCISAAAVARAWASNFLLFFAQVGLHLPEWLASVALIKDGEYLQSLSPLSAVICIVCTFVLLLGVKESSRVNMAVTVMNVSIILFIIIAGATYISTDNYTAAPPLDNVEPAQQCNTSAAASSVESAFSASSLSPFASTHSHQTRYYSVHVTSATSSYLPSSVSFLSSLTPSLGKLPNPPPAKGSYFPKGLNGVLTGAAQVFFSYVGFDSVTTLAEEVKMPKRDLPIGIIATLGISTALYVGATAVLAGMVPWYCVDINAPLARAFTFAGNHWATTLIAACTVTGLSTTVLASLFGQPRIFYRMSKDGLLFSLFQSLHPRSQVPYWGTIITGGVAALISFILSIDSLQNMISIGTLMAFSTVCAGIVILRYQQAAELGQPAQPPTWKTNVVLFLFLFLLAAIGLCVSLTNLASVHLAIPIVLALLMLLPVVRLAFLPQNRSNPTNDIFLCPLVPWLPCTGIFTNVYLICSLDWESYVRIVVWTLLGFAIYFGYGIRYSRLGRKDDRVLASEQAGVVNGGGSDEDRGR